MRTALMVHYEEFLFLIRNSGLFFLVYLCVSGTSPLGRSTQPKTIFQLYDAYVRSTKLIYRHLAIEFGYAYDDDGNLMSDHEIFLQIKVLTIKDFRKVMDEYLGAAHPENRSSRGYGYPNVYVKDLLIFWLHVPAVRDFLKSFDVLLESLDRIKTGEDSIASVEAFRDFANPFIVSAFEEMTEKKALTLQNANPASQVMLAMYLMNERSNEDVL
ncbi:hypothetical protein K7J14_12415 [Treponema zuelzerae]|uniref:Uncharacterized protein n=1 Tax=Teretinema zuelzerae TaxID=156 RepID=A0AAE3JJG5_9SPIR|nr:hypothetical protein [Teretinema zuelzerae]MCD1655498.1 hypothetical protein [Teretinema zuelzerae]